MIKTIFLLILFLFFNTAFSFEPVNDCNSFEKSPLVQIYKIYFNNLKKLDSVWGEFSLNDHLVLITNDSSQKCLIGFANNHNESLFTLNKEIGVEDWSAIDITAANFPPLEGEVVDIVNFYGKSSALIINISKHLFYKMDIMAHEAFHTFFQTDKNMPQWWRHIHREELSEKCYHDYGEKYKQEGELLIAAYDLLLQGQTIAAKKILEYYIQARKERYFALSTIKVLSDNNVYSCTEAETHMEFLEGQAQFVGERTAIELGLISRYSIASDYKYSLYENETGWVEPFYYFGSLQLHIIRLLEKSSFNTYSQELYNSSSHFDASLMKKIESYL